MTITPPHTAAHGGGTLHHYAEFPSQHVAPRPVDLWLPPGYDAGTTRYPVIYMHDGQNVFAPTLAFTGIDWGVDEAIERSMAAGGRAAIVVGVWNTPLRRREYMPQQPLANPGAELAAARFAESADGPPLSDAYLRLLVEEVEPFIDATRRCRRSPTRLSSVQVSRAGSCHCTRSAAIRRSLVAPAACRPTGQSAGWSWWTAWPRCCPRPVATASTSTTAQLLSMRNTSRSRW